MRKTEHKITSLERLETGVKDGQLVHKSALKGSGGVFKWPGFYSTGVSADVLHRFILINRYMD